MTKELKGSLMVLIAGCAWGISGVSGQFLMDQGVSVKLLTSLRLIIAGLVLTGIVGLSQPQQLKKIVKDKGTLVGIFIFAIFGLVLNQFAYLQAIRYTNAGTATVLQYITPVLILAFVCLKNRTRPTLAEVVAIVLAIGGTFVIATHGKLGSLAITPTGLFWGILSAFTYAAYILIPVRLIQKWGSLAVIGLAMLMGGLVFPLATQAWQYEVHLSLSTLLAYLGLIGIGTIFAYTVFLKGVSLVGAVKGSLLASIEPIAAVFFSVILVHETFYAVDIIGMAMIISAVTLVSLRDLLAEKQAKQVEH
ncbi:DMT family transporter [Streptococcus caprae]|uniref:DMT family transporter n=1 Tax=Streptococcus caprae TaxID=1640501 RepID=A0ABV8CVU1_9STRE